MVKVSIVLPIYNVAPYLDEAFQSLINQTLREIEIIAVNDGTTDNSQEYIDKYMAIDSRIKCVKQENRGLSGARNTGMEYVKGEYVYFMDSDDIIELDALETCYNYAKRHDADVCLFDATVFNDDGTPYPKKTPYDRSEFLEEGKRYTGEALFYEVMRRETHRAVVWLQFIRWDYLQRIGLGFYEGIIHEDELFTPQLVLQTDNIYSINRKFIRHRLRNTSIVGKGFSKRNIECYLTVFDELFKFQDSPVIRQFAHYTLYRVFYTGHVIPLKDKLRLFWRAVRSGYLKYIGLKSSLVFLFRS